ncbi:hypothetical protein KAU45_06465, partial [bacterium]|nr:hypothetical protein [bacterium]
MKFCYIDEAGCLGALLGPSIQPVFIICGFLTDASSLYNITNEFIQLKVKYAPKKRKRDHKPYLDHKEIFTPHGCSAGRPKDRLL